jgi:hypothetical protein
MAGFVLLSGLESRIRASTSNRLVSGTKRKAIDLVDSDSDDEPIAFTESKAFSMSNITMNSIVLRYGDSPLVGALRVLAHSEKRRAEHAQQSFDYDGEVEWG